MTHEAVQAWAKRADREVLLPSGQWAKVRLRSAVELLRNGEFPDVLRRRAMEYETGGIDSRALSPEEKMSAYDFMRAFVARSVVALGTEGPASASGEREIRWEAVRITAEDLAELPEDDAAELQAIVSLRKSTITVTAESRAKLHLEEALAPQTGPGEEDRDAAEEAAGPIDAWVPFRDGPRGDPAGADGAAVREVARAGLPRG